MSDKYAAIDHKILNSIDRVREKHGSCTLGQLAITTRMSKNIIRQRCQVLKDRGLVVWAPNVAGSLRRLTDPGQRLFDLTVQTAVEARAALGDGEAITEWCWDVVAMATAAAWPGLIPDEESAPARTGTGPGIPTDGGGAVESETYCAPCDRSFKHTGALFQHRGSKAHLKRVEASA